MDVVVDDVVVHLPKKQQPLFVLPSWKIKAGEIILIKGASGKGKTTFLHLLAGLFLPTQGNVVVGNISYRHLNEKSRCLFRRQNVGIIFQKLNLIDYLTPLENIELALQGKNNVQKSLEALSMVGLADRKNERVSYMSLGEQQRIAVARVLAGQFNLILADEPTSSLDQHNAQSVMQLLLKAGQGKTLIVVSHDMRIEQYFKNIMHFEELIS